MKEEKKKSRKKQTKKKNKKNSGVKIPLKIYVIAFFVLIVFGMAGGSVYYLLNSENFAVKNFIITNNKYLDHDEIISLLNVKERNIVAVDTDLLSKRLSFSPWIRMSQIRKQFPDTIMVRVEETSPIAILHEERDLFLVDDRGLRLEKVQNTPSVLPVINVDSENETLYNEVVDLSAEIYNNTVLRGENIEITGSRPEDISMTVNDTLVLVGSGNYEDKLSSFLQLKDEVNRRGIAVEYIDVRFSKRMIVKPLKNNILKKKGMI